MIWLALSDKLWDEDEKRFRLTHYFVEGVDEDHAEDRATELLPNPVGCMERTVALSVDPPYGRNTFPLDPLEVLAFARLNGHKKD